MVRRMVQGFSYLLIAGGVVLLLGTGLLSIDAQDEQARADREVAQLGPAEPPPVLAPAATPTERTTPIFVAGSAAAPLVPATRDQSDQRVRVVSSPPRHAASGLPSPTRVPRPVPLYPAIRVAAPSIRLDAKVVESPIVHGEWQVPKFAAGHLVGTAEPLQGGNVALSGHVESISSGNVFAHIGQLHEGAIVRLYTRTAVVVYRVARVEAVSRDDVGVLAPVGHETLTLITCTGTWLPLQRDFSQRTIVIADRVG